MSLEQSLAIEAYIDKPKSQEYYKKAFEKYSASGVDQFQWNWSWWAMFGGVFYLLYRKLYIEALVYFILFVIIGMIPFVSLIFWIVSGGVLPYFVYKRYVKTKKQAEENIDDNSQQLEALRAVGGVNEWAIWVAVALHIVMWVFVIYMVFAISMVSNIR